MTSGHFRQSHKATHGLSWIHLRSPTDLLRISFSCHFSKTRSTVDRSPIPPILDKRAIEELLSGKCVCVWSTGGGGGYSQYFLATKKTGVFHPILNLRGLHAYLLMEKFLMETLASILQDLQPGMWMVFLDLKDATYKSPLFPPTGGFSGSC